MVAMFGKLGLFVLIFVIGLTQVEPLTTSLTCVDSFSPQAGSRRPSNWVSPLRPRSSAQGLCRTAPITAYQRIRPTLWSKQRYDEDDDDGYNDVSSPKFREVTEEEMRLRQMAKNTQNSFPRELYDDIDDNDDPTDRDYYLEEGIRSRVDRVQNGRRPESYGNSFDDNIDDGDFYEDEDFDKDEPIAGNYWSNSVSNLDRPTRRGMDDRQRRRYDIYGEEDEMRRRPRRRPPPPQQQGRRRQSRKQSPAPSGFGEPPRVLKDFYDQLFWYGFDADDSAKVGDNNVFGGTKGKFNGFNYLLEEQSEDKSKRSRPRLPPSNMNGGGALTRRDDRRPRRNDEIDYYSDSDDSDDNDYGNYVEDDDRANNNSYDSKIRKKSNSSYTPPTDETSTRYDPIYDYDKYESDDDDYPDNRRRNSVRYDNEDDYVDRRSGGRRRRRQRGKYGAEWSPLSMVESFLGIDREEMNYKADVYNSKMGLGKRRRSGQQGRRQLSQKRRSTVDGQETRGYAYQYDSALDDESMPILDVDLAEDEDTKLMIQRRQLSPDLVGNDEATSQKKERSWEERQIAMDRVPPVDIKAWGPSGELPMSAREKAFMDGQEDIETARRKLNQMKKQESDAKEEIAILKVDAERQRLKLSEYPPERRSRRDMEELRQIELDIDDASRNLRRCRTKSERALQRLEEFEERHYAIMSCYNIDQASFLIGESLNQFSASVQGTSIKTITATSNTNDSDTIDDTTMSKTKNATTNSIEK